MKKNAKMAPAPAPRTPRDGHDRWGLKARVGAAGVHTRKSDKRKQNKLRKEMGEW